jgi:hypothetical protein
MDIHDHFHAYDRVRRILPIEFRIRDDADGLDIDPRSLVFIDGDHRYESCRADYRSLGLSAAVCGFHDIHDRFVARHPSNNGGVPRLWRELVGDLCDGENAFEFLDHSEGESIMGIGLIVRASVRRSDH